MVSSTAPGPVVSGLLDLLVFFSSLYSVEQYITKELVQHAVCRLALLPDYSGKLSILRNNYAEIL